MKEMRTVAEMFGTGPNCVSSETSASTNIIMHAI